MPEFFGVRTFILLDWFVSDYNSRKKQYSFAGDKGEIQAADLAATEGAHLLGHIKSRIRPVLKMGFELREEFVPTSVEGQWFNMRFLSFGLESKNLEKATSLNFILEKIKQLGLKAPKLSFKLFYLPSYRALRRPKGII